MTMYENDTHSVEETSLFLDGADGKESGYRSGETHSRRRTQRWFTTLWLSNVALLCVCVLLSLHIFWASPTGCVSDYQSQISDTYSPANDAVEYEYRQIFNDSRFLGPPRAEWEELMETIMSGTLIRVSDDELVMHGSDSIPLKDGGYAAGLGVAHSLHCVRLIKRFIYREESYPGMSLISDNFQHTQIHADHCLDYLRQSVMCQVDYTMYTLYWAASQQDIPAHHAPGPQKCVNWDKLHAWMSARSANTNMLMDPGSWFFS